MNAVTVLMVAGEMDLLITAGNLIAHCNGLIELPEQNTRLKQQKTIFLQSGGWKSEITMLAELTFSESSFLTLSMMVFSLCLHIVFLSAYLCPNLFSYNDGSHITITQPHLILT